MPEALLSRTDLAQLRCRGAGSIDAMFRELDVVLLPRFSRPFVRVADYLGLVERSTFRDDRVRTRASSGIP